MPSPKSSLPATRSLCHRVLTSSTRIRYITNILFFAFALYAAVYGVTYAYHLHPLVNALCAWLFVVHLSAGPLSLARLAAVFSRGNTNSNTNDGNDGNGNGNVGTVAANIVASGVRDKDRPLEGRGGNSVKKKP